MPTAQFHEILPDLFQGGHNWESTLNNWHEADLSEANFDLVVSLYVEHWNPASWPKRGEHIIEEFNDHGDVLTSPLVLARLDSLSRTIADSWLRGQKVLVRCQAGYNRSGLVMALALLRLGYDATYAINLLREKRSPHVLFNQHFEQYVRDHEAEFYDSEAWTKTVEVIRERASEREDKERWDS